MSYKISLVRYLIRGALHIIFHNELEKIKVLLHKNMYPKIVVDNQTKSFLEKQFT